MYNKQHTRPFYILFFLILCPSLLLLWMQKRNLDQEKEAVLMRQQQSISKQLNNAQQTLQDFWKNEQAWLNHVNDLNSFEEVLTHVKSHTQCDAIIIQDQRNKQLYPSLVVSVNAVKDDSVALKLIAEGRHLEAAREYEFLVQKYKDQVRSGHFLLKSVQQFRLARKTEQALRNIINYQSFIGVQEARDQHGQLIQANLLLLFIELSLDTIQKKSIMAELVRLLPRVRKINTAQSIFIQGRLKAIDPSLGWPLYDLEQNSLAIAENMQLISQDYLVFPVLKGRFKLLYKRDLLIAHINSLLSSKDIQITQKSVSSKGQSVKISSPLDDYQSCKNNFV